jgi:hypothetical protein
MTPLVPIAMFGWPLVVVVLFTVLPPRRAVIVGMLGAWLFLPIAAYPLPGLPDITKMSITCVSVFVGAVLVDAQRFARLRWNWVDLAMLTWVLVPLPSAVTAGYGPYEGVAGVLTQITTWGMPYLIGRLYFSDADGLRELAISIFIGGLVYAPFVLLEARMSPQLHTWVYGFHQHDFYQTKREGGWRPTVFMQHGLGVAMFMGTAAVCGLWLWKAGRTRAIYGVPVWTLALGLFVVAAACRSSYALMLMVTAIAALFVSRWLNTRLILAALLAIAPAYVAARTVGGWDAGLLKETASAIGNARLYSLETRLTSEDMLWHWVQGNLPFGKCRLVELMHGRHVTGKFIPDGLWLIALGKYGLVGLVSMFGVLLLPVAAYLRRLKPRVLMSPEMTGATVLMAVLVMYAMDNLLNALLNPIYLLAAGGLAVCGAPRRQPVAVPQQLRPAAPSMFDPTPFHPGIR